MSHKAKLTTVQKWEKELNTDLDYDVKGNKVICLIPWKYKTNRNNM